MSESSHSHSPSNVMNLNELGPRSPAPLSSNEPTQRSGAAQMSMKKSQAMSLYTSHLLSTWNARTYEFAAIIFTASVYPDTLAASSIRGIITTLASIALSSPLGRWVDRAPDRLRTLLTTITANRVSVLAACAFWILIVPDGTSSARDTWKAPLFSIVLVLGILEKLSGTANMISMERDWIVAAAAPDGHAYDLTQLNAVMRRIDLSCKLAAPILISAVISAASVRAGVLTVGGMSAVSWMVEWWCAKKAWNGNASLQCPSSDARQVEIGRREGLVSASSGWFSISGISNAASQWMHQYAHDFAAYFSSRAWRPSFALTMLHISVLSYSATFITYLLSAGFSLTMITFARAIGSVVEICSTLVTPIGVVYLGKAHHHRDPEVEDEALIGDRTQEARVDTETGLERLGLWGITWQLLNLIPVVLVLWALSPSPPPVLFRILSRLTDALPSASTPFLAFILFTFLSLSRLGLWTFDLTTQQLSQTLVSPSQRSAFAGVESSLISAFELLHHVSTIVLSQPAQFQYLATGSVTMVGVSAMVYAGWVRRQRGHLVHWEKMSMGAGCGAKRRG